MLSASLNNIISFLPLCVMVHIKDRVLLIKKFIPWCGGSWFPLLLSEWLFIICPEAKKYLIKCHTQHIIYSYRAYGKGPLGERGNPLPPHGLLILISSKGSFFYAPSHRQDCIYHGLCYTSCGTLVGMRNSSMGPLSVNDPPQSYILLHNMTNAK